MLVQLHAHYNKWVVNLCRNLLHIEVEASLIHVKIPSIKL